MLYELNGLDLMFFGLMLNVPANFSVMLGWSHRFLGIPVLLGGKYVLLKDTTRRHEWSSNPCPLDPESEVIFNVIWCMVMFGLRCFNSPNCENGCAKNGH